VERSPDYQHKPGWLDRIVPAFVLAYAIWTIYVNALTTVHASFDTLMRWLPLLSASALAVVWVWSKSTPRASQSAQASVAISLPTEAFSYPFTALLLAGMWVTLLIIGGHYILFWWGSVVALGGAWVSTINGGPLSFRQEPVSKRLLLIVMAVALAAACVTLIASRPDADDTFYLSIPATLLRLPEQPVLLHDTIYRLANLPLQLPVYRIHSYEVLIGTLARITGIPPAVMAYLFLPSFFAILSVIAWTQLLRLLAPKQTALTLIILFACILMLGETHKGYGNFAFVRMFQGKAILATFIVPCIVYLALEYSRHGTMHSWVALFAAQITAIGITSSGLFVVPAAAGFALLSAWSPDALSTRRLVFGILASSYLFLAAAALASITHGGEDFVSSTAMPPMLPWLDQTMGPWSVALLLTTLLSSWAFAEGRAQARVLLTCSLCFLVAVINPYTYQFVADHFTGWSTYWRLFWALPLPFMLAILLGQVLRRVVRIKPTALAVAACLALAAGCIMFFSHAGSLRRVNHVSLGMPGLKVPTPEYSVAKKLAATIPEDGTLLAPESVATWLPTFVFHPELLASRGMYLSGAFGKDEGKRRLELQQYVAGTQRSPTAPSELRVALTHYALTAVVVTRAASWQTEIAQILSASGWHCVTQGPYDIWTKDTNIAPR
jgi:hypothetical protein